MFRVYVMFVIRKMKSPLFLELATLLISFFAITSMVSVQNVIANTPHSIGNLYHFWTFAFMNTKIIIQIMTVLLGLAGVFLLKDLVYYVRRLPKYRLVIAK